jgi:predicted SprT family Zn-dependent metalloprotease
MPLLRQLEFSFGTIVGQAFRLPNLEVATEAVALQFCHHDLQTTARDLLRSLDAHPIARELRVEWNSRLKTAAGRADYRQKLILLNPRLLEHPSEIDRTLCHELAHILAQFRAGRRRILPHGDEWRAACRDLGIGDEKRCHNLPFAGRTYASRFVYRCPNCKQKFPRVRRVRRAVACLACCRKHNGGEFDPRFRLRLVMQSL